MGEGQLLCFALWAMNGPCDVTPHPSIGLVMRNGQTLCLALWIEP